MPRHEVGSPGGGHVGAVAAFVSISFVIALALGVSSSVPGEPSPTFVNIPTPVIRSTLDRATAGELARVYFIRAEADRLPGLRAQNVNVDNARFYPGGGQPFWQFEVTALMVQISQPGQRTVASMWVAVDAHSGAVTALALT